VLLEHRKTGAHWSGKMEAVMSLRISTEATFICEVMLLRIFNYLRLQAFAYRFDMSEFALSTWGIFRGVREECKFTRGLMRAKSDVCSCLVIALENSQMSRIARIWQVTPISVDIGRFHLISRQQFNKIAFVFKGDIDHSISFPCNFLDSCWPARWDSISESIARPTATRLSYRPDIARRF